MIKAIKEKLLTGSIKRVVIYGETDVMPEPPYVVIKTEASPGAGLRQIRIIVHFPLKKTELLSQYVFFEIERLLVYDMDKGGKVFITNSDGEYRLYPSGYTDIQNDPGDNTIFMERLFQQPFRKGGNI